MRRAFAVCLVGVLAAAGVARASVPPQPKTIYHLAESSWAVGVVQLTNPLKFREGKVIVYPGQLTDLVWAPNHTKPHNMMVVVEILPSDQGKAYLEPKDKFFAAIRLLPEHAYWKDNLPATRRHEVAGGQKYVFRGDQSEEAKKVLAAYLAAHDLKGMERWSAQITAVAQGLGSSIPVIREDSVEYLATWPTLGRDFGDKALAPVKAYLAGDAPDAEKQKLIDALGRAKVAAARPLLAELAGHKDAVGEAAQRALSHYDEKPPAAATL